MTKLTKFQPTVDLGYPTGQHGEIPSFANIEEEAEFWDTHDFTDFSELDDADSAWMVHPGGRSEVGEPLIVSLEPDERRALVDQAREQNIEPTALATMWLKDRLRVTLEKAGS